MKTLITILIALLALQMIACNNKMEIPAKIKVETTPIHVDPVKIEVSGEVLIKLVQSISTDPVLQQTIDAACQQDATCSTETATNILNSIISGFSSGNVK